jgi:ABC-type antimicrobial peptide transport system permease subunit
MNISDLALISIRQVYRMRRRYRGPFIGATLGVAALIAVVTLGDLIQTAIGSNLSVLGGATIVKVNINLEERDYKEDPRQFSDQDMGIISKMPGVVAVASSVYSWWPTRLEFNASYKSKEYERVRIMGIDPEFFNLTAFLPMAHGRKFTDDDVKTLKNVCIIGNEIKRWFFKDNESPLGKTILVGPIYCEIVGVLGKPDDIQLDETVFVPISTARMKIEGLSAVRRLSVLAADIYQVEEVSNRIQKTLFSRKSKYPYEISFDKERVSSILSILNNFTFFVYAAVAAALILSGVGVANVMLATIRERTSEIGLRKAVGATNLEVAAQFLSESIIISVISSVLGIIIGTTIMIAISLIALNGELEMRMYVLSVLASVAICAISGVASGLMPAAKAAGLDPIVALRTE